MDADRWQRISRLSHEALKLPVDQRDAFLDACCQGDEALRGEVASLLAHEASAKTFLATPAADVVDPPPIDHSKQPRAGLEPGVRLGTYRIERPLGRGGMGVVFLAHDTTLHRPVALKVLGSPVDDGTARDRLLREARTAAALNHPNICTVYEVGESDGCAFIAMEYVEGLPLSDRLAESALPLAEAVRYGIAAADALAHAHEHGVVHRDLKAANAIITKTGRLTLVDFGLARREDALLTDATTMASVAPAGAAAGTPYAMAPEQVRGAGTDARTDIWALGVLLYEMVSGAKPFRATTIPELFSSILRDAPASLPNNVPVEVQSVIEHCLAKEPERRYHDADDVRRALEAIQAGNVPLWVAWRARVRRRPVAAATGVGLAVAALLIGANAGGVRERLSGTPAAVEPIKLAVLPFENLTGDPEQEYFSDGLTEEMITQLGRLHPQRLSVIARTSSMRYKNRDVAIDQIGRELGVDYVMEGSARKEGNRVRISATLIQVRDQTQRWTESFDRELAGILTLQGDVARSVAGSLRLTLAPAEQAWFANARPANPEAYDAYLRGLSYLDRFTPADVDGAQRYFELALEKDPTYALAYTGIGRAWSYRQQFGAAQHSQTAPAMRAALTKASELDETLPEVHYALAMQATWTDWDWPAAEPSFRRAIDLNPSYAEARAFYSHYLHIMKRPEEAMTQIQRATELDPLNPSIQALYAADLVWAQRYDEAIVQARNALRTAPANTVALTQLETALYETKRYDEALAVLKTRWTKRVGPEVEEAINRGYAEGGYRGAMRRTADMVAARWPALYTNPRAVATAYLRAGQNEQALEWLERAYELRDPNMPYMDLGPSWDVVRDHPRFQALLQRMKLPS
ncbi:MAG: protein kinase domain-containing protein [Vicinamibacterales bacterium]